MKHRFKMICLPFAGGSSYSYYPFRKYVPDNLELVNVELPGRATRVREGLLDDIQRMVDDIFNQVRTHIRSPYIIYGHSMGTLLGFLLAHRIIGCGLDLPAHLFFSGRGGPSADYSSRNRHLLPGSDFREELKKIGGSSLEILEDERLLKYFDPILRADFKAVETYEHVPLPPLAIPMTIMAGDLTDVTQEEAEAWGKECVFPPDLIRFEGGHFFIFDHPREVMRSIADKLYQPAVYTSNHH
jgi:surfactin synthase thioesterase subunit